MGTPAEIAPESPRPPQPPEAGAGGAANRVIEVAGLSKSFEIPQDEPSTLKERVLHPLRTRHAETLHAVQDVSFDVGRGEFVAIVGRNGSGKSTLLKMLAGIYQADSGTIRIDGRVSPFIELGVGFNPELAARDNVVMNCNLLGLSRAEGMRRFESIVRFAELEDFVDLKLKNYSSGMLVRLAFSTAIQVDAEILLLDEVLAVGDSGFQEKCFDVFSRMILEGKTIVLVTHGLDAVERFADRVIYLDGGRVQTIGPPEPVIERYLADLRHSARDDLLADMSTETERQGDRSAEVIRAWFEDAAGNPASAFEQGEKLVFRFEAEFHHDGEEAIFGVTVRSERGDIVVSASSPWAGLENPRFAAGDRYLVTLEFENLLGVGRWYFSPGINYGPHGELADLRNNMATTLVRGRRWTGGAVDLPLEMRLERL